MAETSLSLTKPSPLQTSSCAGTRDPGTRRSPGAPQDCLLPALWPTQVRVEGSPAQHEDPRLLLAAESCLPTDKAIESLLCSRAQWEVAAFHSPMRALARVVATIFDAKDITWGGQRSTPSPDTSW